MKRDHNLRHCVASNAPFVATSQDGDVLTIFPSEFPTVLLRDSVREGEDSLWTIRSSAARSLLSYVREVGFAFSLNAFLHPTENIWIPVLLFRMVGSGQTLAYTLGLVGQAEFAEFFSKFPDIDLLVADTTIVTRSAGAAWPVPFAVAEAMRLGAASFETEPDQKGLIRAMGRTLP